MMVMRMFKSGLVLLSILIISILALMGVILELLRQIKIRI